MTISTRVALIVAVAATSCLNAPCTAWNTYYISRSPSPQFFPHKLSRSVQQKKTASNDARMRMLDSRVIHLHEPVKKLKDYEGDRNEWIIKIENGAKHRRDSGWPDLPILVSLDKILTSQGKLDKNAPLLSWKIALALAFVVPHGLSDLCTTLPSRITFLGGHVHGLLGVGAVYASAAALTLSMPKPKYRYLGLLWTASLFHMRGDLPALMNLVGNLCGYTNAALPSAISSCNWLITASWVYTIALHLCWVKWPALALVYLSMLHTGLHYCTLFLCARGVVDNVCVAGWRASVPVLPVAVALFGATTCICFYAFRQWSHHLMNSRWVREGMWIAPVIAHIYCVG